jgi:prepilin-type N-terminal cleavage/methylation domain-containing protein
MRQSKGFTLIELMIVITIIAVIAAIAVPSLLRARIQANEASAVGNLRALASGQISYHGANNTYGDFDDLLSKDPPWVDGVWVDGGSRMGYVFNMPNVEVNNFAANADPVEENLTGIKHYYVDASGVIRWEEGGPADNTSEPIPNP